MHLRLLRTRRRRDIRPSAETIESRALLSGFSPTDVEQLYLQLLDDARFNPAAYGTSLGIDLSSVAPAQPLAMNPLLVESARLHSQDMIAQDYFDHFTPQGGDPGGRIAATGFGADGWAESIETNTNPSQPGGGFAANYGTWDAGVSLAHLIVDQGVPDLGHRIMLLDIGGSDVNMRQVGIGIASDESSGGYFNFRQTDTTIDLAATTDTRPYLTGVVFHDTAGDGKFEPGEGLGGVTITVAGVGSTQTMDAGGYATQLAPGTYTVTASGGGLPTPIARTVVLGNANVRLNFDEDPNGALLTAAPSGAASGQLGTFTAMSPGDTAASYSARIDWGDGNASFATLTANPGGTFNVQGSNTYASTGVYAVRVLVTHLSDGQTVALNATAAVSSSTYAGPTFPNPGYFGQGGSGPGSYFLGDNGSGNGGSGTTTPAGQDAHHKKKHPKHPPKLHHALHAAGKHPFASRPRPRVTPHRSHRPH